MKNQNVLPLSPAMMELLRQLDGFKPRVHVKHPRVHVSYGIRSGVAHAWIPGDLHSAFAPRTVHALNRRGILEWVSDSDSKDYDWRWATYLLTDKGKRIIRTLKKAGQL